MAKAGDFYSVTLKTAHLSWGEHRHTNTRGIVYGEGYIPIPASVARDLEIYNSNQYDGEDELGGNLFNCISADGSYRGILKAQGNNEAGSVYAKQFSEQGDLQGIGSWYAEVDANEGDEVEVRWISETDVIITLFK